MRVLLLAGTAHGYITAHIADPWTTMNEGGLRVRETAGYLQNLTIPGPDAIVITDEGLPDGLAADMAYIHTLLEHLSPDPGRHSGNYIHERPGSERSLVITCKTICEAQCS